MPFLHIQKSCTPGWAKAEGAMCSVHSKKDSNHDLVHDDGTRVNLR